MTLVLGMLLDALLGEPKWLWSRLPHPAVLMGRLIGWADARFNKGSQRRARGVALLAGLVALGWALGTALAALPGAVAEVLALAVLLAQRSLVDHVRAVSDGLRRGLPDGRAAVAMIVSRDTGAMDDAAVARSAIESAAENLSDGVIAPVFWFAVAGLPGLLVYKMVNTADSMVGYLTPRHAEFGWASARCDDLLNLVPARLTAALMLTVTGRWDVWRAVVADARRHRSPNAGWPEAALAHALGYALAGPRSYDGQMRDFPFVNGADLRALGPAQIEASVRLLWRTWGLALGGALLVALV